MGRAYTDIVTFSSPLTLAFLGQVRTLIDSRLAYSPRARGTSWYFSQSGSDITGTGTRSNPFKTIARARTLLADDTRLRFKRGDTWRETTGVDLSGFDNVTIDDYGDLNDPKPVWSKFTLQYATDSWTATGTDRWYQSQSTAVAWVRDADDPFNFMARQDSTANVEATPWSWYHSGTVLHVNVGAGKSVTNYNLEAVLDNSDNGVLINTGCDGCRVQGVRFDGWGINTTNTNTQAEGVHSRTTGTEENVVVECECYYTSSHALAHNQPSVGGGILTLVGCRAGGMMFNSASENVFNSYASTGGQEFLLDRCRAAYGTLPSSDFTYSGTLRTTNPVYCHTATGEVSLLLSRGLVIEDNAYGVRCAVNGVDLPDPAGDITVARGFDISTIFEPGRSHTGNSSYPFLEPIVRINCAYHWKPSQTTQGTIQLSADPSGWLLNCDLVNDQALQTGSPDRRGWWNSAGTSGDLKMYHCRIHVLNVTNRPFLFEYDNYGNTSAPPAGATQNVELKNCILIAEGANTKTLGVNNIASKMDSNAYYGWAASTDIQGFSNDANAVTLSGVVEYGERPTAANGTLHAGSDLSLEYDFYGKPRGNTPSIGPVEEESTESVASGQAYLAGATVGVTLPL